MSNINIEFNGGLELIFKNKQLSLKFEKEQFTLQELVDALKSHIIERPEFFLTKEGKVRPGVLVLINDSDWELFDKEHTILSNNDTVSFISTLHGG